MTKVEKLKLYNEMSLEEIKSKFEVSMIFGEVGYNYTSLDNGLYYNVYDEDKEDKFLEYINLYRYLNEVNNNYINNINKTVNQDVANIVYEFVLEYNDTKLSEWWCNRKTEHFEYSRDIILDNKHKLYKYTRL